MAKMIEVTVKVPERIMQFLKSAKRAGWIKTTIEQYLSDNLLAIVEAEIDAQFDDAKPNRKNHESVSF